MSRQVSIHPEILSIPLGKATLNIAAEHLVELLLGQPDSAEGKPEKQTQYRPSQTLVSIPRIGEIWDSQGGIYCGILAGENGAPDRHLIAALPESEITDLTWQAAIEAAAKPQQGFDDWALPTRREARLVAVNAPATFDKDGWYWTSEQHAAYSGFAWIQDFSDGGQDNGLKSNEYRARAVRSFSIIQ
jgi:hypothetical protein